MFITNNKSNSISGKDPRVDWLIQQLDSINKDDIGKVMLDVNSTAKYLSNFLDNNTIIVDKGVLKIKSIDGLQTTIAELNNIRGLNSNIMEKFNDIRNGMSFKGVANSYNNLKTQYPTPQNGYMVIVSQDETKDNKRIMYIYNGNEWVSFGEFDIKVRDFTIDPINLKTEVIGKLSKSNIETLTAKDITVDSTEFNKNLKDKNIKNIQQLADEVDNLKSSGNIDINDIDLSNYYTKTQIDNLNKDFVTNQDIIHKSEIAEKIEGADSASPNTFYGKDDNGNVGFHFLPINNNEGTSAIKQRVKLNSKTNEDIIIDLNEQQLNDKLIIQTYKFKEGEQNIIKTLKHFDNSEETNFFYNKENVKFDVDGVSIRDLFKYQFNSNDNAVFNKLIDKHILSQFKSIKDVRCSEIKPLKEDYIQISPKNLLSNNDKGFKISSNSIYSSDYEPYTAFDNDLRVRSGTYWSSKQDETQNIYVQIEYPKEINVQKIDLYSYSKYSPKDYSILASNDNIHWDTLFNGTIPEQYASDDNNDFYSVEFANNNYYKTYKVLFLNNYGANFVYVIEMRMYTSVANCLGLIKKDQNYFIVKNKILEKIDINNYDYKNKNSIMELIDYMYKSNKMEDIVLEDARNNLKDYWICGVKQSELILANNNISTKIAHNIDWFKLNYQSQGDGTIRLVFSIDNGLTWLTSKDNKAVKINLNIPLKQYSELNEDEKIKWHNAKDVILQQGIIPNYLSAINFNEIIKDNKIRFAYVINKNSYDDIAEINSLDWQFDSKGSMLLTNNIDIELLENCIKVIPREDNSMLKINILT